jgi:molybdenum cofactor cytidylyltransferase
VTVALIPAAGRSARLGQPKQLVTLRGEPLVHRAARVAREAGCRRVVVVEGAVPLGGALADLEVELLSCAEWARGPGASLRAGARAIAEEGDILVLLADQHRVTPAHLRALLAAPGAVVAAHYAGDLGVPALFRGAMTSVLRALPDEAGARAWLRRNAASVTAVPCAEAEADLDTPDALAALER